MKGDGLNQVIVDVSVECCTKAAKQAGGMIFDGEVN